MHAVRLCDLSQIPLYPSEWRAGTLYALVLLDAGGLSSLRLETVAKSALDFTGRMR